MKKQNAAPGDTVVNKAFNAKIRIDDRAERSLDKARLALGRSKRQWDKRAIVGGCVVLLGTQQISHKEDQKLNRFVAHSFFLPLFDCPL